MSTDHIDPYPDIPSNIKGVINHYLFFHNYAVTKYNKPGYKPVVFMQYGSFYESYAIKNDNGDQDGADVKLLSKILGYAIFPKYNAKGVGVPEYIIDEVAAQLMVKDYTHVIRVDEVEKGVKRYDASNKPIKGELRRITRVYTAGTYSATKEILSDRMVKNRYSDFLGVLCHIYIKKFKRKSEAWQQIVISICSVDVNTAESEIYEFGNNIEDPNLGYDELHNYLLQRKPSEVIVSHDDSNEVDDCLKSVPNGIKYHVNNNIEPEYFNLDYQKQYLTKLFPDQNKPIRYLGLERNQYSVANFLLTVQYIYENYPDLTKNLKKPKIIDGRSNVILANDAITQLGIYDYNIGPNNSHSSVFDLINKCSTNMGSALLKYRLLNPIINPGELEQRYAYVAHFIRENRWKNVEHHLKGYPDLVRMHRRIDLGIISPAMITVLHKIYGKLSKLLKLVPRCNSLLTENFFENVENFRKSLSVLDFEIAATYNSIADIDKNIFKKGHNEILDKINRRLKRNMEFVGEVCGQLGKITNVESKNPIVVLKYQAGGYHLSSTKTWFNLIEKCLKESQLAITYKDKSITCKKKDLATIKTSKNRIEFTFPAIRELSTEYEEAMRELSSNFGSSYKKFLSECSSQYGSIMYSISKIVSEIDVYKALAKTAVKYNYCRPNINEEDNNNPGSFIISKQLRNPIVERDTSKEYMPHNISLGVKSTDEIIENTICGQIALLFGMNTSGKSTCMRAVGISVIMAQAGCYVPAEEYNYHPFKSIFTRILTSDDQTKSISSFEREMIELLPMVTRSNEYSLINGDELCHSTSHPDACGLVAASVIEMSKNNVRGIMTTHLHELIDNEDLMNNEKISVYHIEVNSGGKNTKCNRLIKSGPGKVVYGIEIAAGLNLPQNIIKNAYKFRRNLLGQSQLFLTMKTSNYDSGLFMDTCSICENKKAEETHHDRPQKDAENGFIGHVPINAKYNLIKICKTCHIKITNNRIN